MAGLGLQIFAHFQLRYRARLILDIVSQDLRARNVSSWMKGLFDSREWGGQNCYLSLYNDRLETWHVVFFSSNLSSVTDPLQGYFYSC